MLTYAIIPLFWEMSSKILKIFIYLNEIHLYAIIAVEIQFSFPVFSQSFLLPLHDANLENEREQRGKGETAVLNEYGFI